MKELRRIVAFYDTLDQYVHQCALLTVVHIDGSSYRRIGARMLISTDGRWEGGISGGCLEGDAQRKAQFAIQKGQVTIVRYDTREEDDKQIGIGLGCNGLIDVLLCPINKNDSSNPIEIIRSILTTRANIYLYTYLPPHHLAGLAVLECPKTLDHPFSSTDIFTSKAKKLAFENAEILVERIRPQIRLIIFGDNYDIYPLIQLAAVLDWEISLVGKRTKFRSVDLSHINKIYDWTEAGQLQYDTFTAVILMSHDYNRDFSTLRKLIDTSVSYIGVLGPKKRFQKMIDDAVIHEYDISFAKDSRIYSPIGLDIGAETPEEIASSIVSEIVAHYRNKSSLSLRDKPGPIHDRA